MNSTTVDQTDRNVNQDDGTFYPANVELPKYCPNPAHEANDGAGDLSGEGCPPQAGTPPEILPCLIGNISIENKGYLRKRMFCLQKEIECLIERNGVEKVGFLTLTFGEDIQDFREAKRRWNSAATNLLRGLFPEWIVAWERQESGRIHAHIVVACREDIKTGVRWYEDERGARYMGGAGVYLRGLWSTLRDKLVDYGFGRHELLPVRKTGEALAKYVSGYMSKSVRLDCDKGVRLVEYSRRSREYRSSFSWNTASNYQYRLLLKHIADMAKQPDMSRLQSWIRSTGGAKGCDGSRWWFENREMLRAGKSWELMTMDERMHYCHLQQPFVGQVVAMPAPGESRLRWFRLVSIRETDGMTHREFAHVGNVDQRKARPVT